MNDAQMLVWATANSGYATIVAVAGLALIALYMWLLFR